MHLKHNWPGKHLGNIYGKQRNQSMRDFIFRRTLNLNWFEIAFASGQELYSIQTVRCTNLNLRLFRNIKKCITPDLIGGKRLGSFSFKDLWKDRNGELVHFTHLKNTEHILSSLLPKCLRLYRISTTFPIWLIENMNSLLNRKKRSSMSSEKRETGICKNPDSSFSAWRCGIQSRKRYKGQTRGLFHWHYFFKVYHKLGQNRFGYERFFGWIIHIGRWRRYYNQKIHRRRRRKRRDCKSSGKIDLPVGVGSLSARFMRECSAIMLTQWIRYDEAVKAMGFDHSKPRANCSYDRLPYYGEVLSYTTVTPPKTFYPKIQKAFLRNRYLAEYRILRFI